MTVIGYYRPEGPSKFIRQQVGYFNDGQGAERSTLIGTNPQLVGYAVFANYLNVQGRLGDFHKYLPQVFKDAKELESVLIFES